MTTNGFKNRKKKNTSNEYKSEDWICGFIIEGIKVIPRKI